MSTTEVDKYWVDLPKLPVIIYQWLYTNDTNIFDKEAI